MIEKLTNYIVDCQIASGKIKEEEGSVYRYGYTLFFEKLINIVIALIICLITGKWLAVGLFLLAVIPFRSFQEAGMQKCYYFKNYIYYFFGYT